MNSGQEFVGSSTAVTWWLMPGKVAWWWTRSERSLSFDPSMVLASTAVAVAVWVSAHSEFSRAMLTASPMISGWA